MSDLPLDLLQDVIKRTANLSSAPRSAASQLARLKAVNKEFRSAASSVLDESPAHREAVVRSAIIDAEVQWSRKGWAPAEREWIGARLAHALRNLDQVTVALNHIGDPLRDVEKGAQVDWSRLHQAPQVVRMVLDVLATHPGLRSLDVSAENDQLSQLAEMASKRPGLLRSLRVGVYGDRTYTDGPESQRTARDERVRTELGKVLASQKNLTTLKLEDARVGQAGRAHLHLRSGGLDKVMGSLAGLRSLTLSHFQVTPDDATALAAVLRNLPALEELDLSHLTLDGAAVVEIASSLPSLQRLRRINLQGTTLAGASAGLANALHDLAELQVLNLASTGIAQGDMERLANGLAGLRQLQTLDVSYNVLDQGGRSSLIAALADVPTLRHLYLRALWDQKPPSLDRLKEDLAPLAGNQELHVYLQMLARYDAKSKPKMDKVRAEVPCVHFVD